MYIVRVKSLFNYEHIYLIPMILSAIISTRSFLRNSHLRYKLFSSLLLLTVFIEIFAICWQWFLHKNDLWNYEQSNLWIYNAFLIVRHVMTLSFINFIIHNSTLKKIIKWSLLPFILFSVANYFFIQTPFNINSITIISSNVILITASLFYFKQLLEQAQIIRLSSKPEVWISLGVFLYYCGTLPFFILFNKLIASASPQLNSFLLINDTMNIIMYSLYLIGFLCLPQNQK